MPPLQSDLSTYVRDDTASQTDEDAFTPVTARKRKAPSTDASSLADSRDESPVPAKKKRTKKDPEEARLEKVHHLTNLLSLYRPTAHTRNTGSQGTG